jgi:UDP-arabinose 4-epimerase
MATTILVTGGAGFVGAHTCKALAQAGYRPVAFDNLSRGHESFVRWGPLVKGDLRNTALIRDVCQMYGVVATIHLAAFCYVDESMREPETYYENNVAGTISLLAALREAQTKVLVFSSTCAVYGEPEHVPLVEHAEKRPVNPYGASKLIVERMLADYGRAYDLRWMALRYFNAAGADLGGELGELREREVRLIPKALSALQGDTIDFCINGTDFPTQDGTAIRDYVHVSDLAQAHVLSLHALLNGSESGELNIGTGRGYSIYEVLAEIEKTTGSPVPFTIGPRRPGDPAILIADTTAARLRLGFCPLHSDLETIIRTAWAWRKKCALAKKTDRASTLEDSVSEI